MPDLDAVQNQNDSLPLGQGVKKIQEPPDPFEDKKELTELSQIMAPEVKVEAAEPPTPPTPQTPPPAASTNEPPHERLHLVKKETDEILKNVATEISESQKQTTPALTVVETTSPPPSSSETDTATQTPEAAPPPPPPVPPAPPIDNIAEMTKIQPKSGRFKVLLAALLAVLVLGGLSAAGFYFWKQFNQKPTAPGPTLELTPLSSPSAQSSPSSIFKVSSPLAEKAFGALPPPDFSRVLLTGLNLSTAVISNEATPSADTQKGYIYEFTSQTAWASSSALLNRSELAGATANGAQSLYPLKTKDEALSELLAEANAAGSSSPDVDWKRNRLTSLSIKSIDLAHFSSGRFIYLIYVISGGGKVLGRDFSTPADVSLNLFVPAVKQ